MSPDVSRTLNALGLLAISLVLAGAFLDQFIMHELPCPLCLLQRAGFVGACIGLALNIKFGPSPLHYGLTILAAMAGAAVAMRQTLLHIAPGDAGFGAAILGLHLYTWAFVVFTLIILGCAGMLLFERQFDRSVRVAAIPTIGMVALAVAALMAFGNGASTVLECGGGLCPDNPTTYELLQKSAPPAR